MRNRNGYMTACGYVRPDTFPKVDQDAAGAE